MKKVRILLKEGFEKVTDKTCKKLIKKAFMQEDAFWDEDTEKLL